MIRFLTLHWPKLGVLALFYVIAGICLTTLANTQIDTVQTQVDSLQFVKNTTTDF
jgi:hypothetical protein